MYLQFLLSLTFICRRWVDTLSAGGNSNVIVHQISVIVDWLPSVDCRWASLMMSQTWFEVTQASAWSNADAELCHHMSSKCDNGLNISSYQKSSTGHGTTIVTQQGQVTSQSTGHDGRIPCPNESLIHWFPHLEEDGEITHRCRGEFTWLYQGWF